MPTRKAERQYWNDGHLLVAGLDEVGRGAYGGPVTAAAVILPPRCILAGVTDSKLLSPAARSRMATDIKKRATAIGVGWANSDEVDAMGLTRAVLLAGSRALHDMTSSYSAVILDGNHNYLHGISRSKAIIRADSSCLCVAAASVIAKVARDNYMERLALQLPEYGFDSHKGYGAPSHIGAIKSYGLTKYHRRRWQPLKEFASVD